MFCSVSGPPVIYFNHRTFTVINCIYKECLIIFTTLTVETFLCFDSKVLQCLCVFPHTEPGHLDRVKQLRHFCGSAQCVQMEIIRSLFVFVTLLFQFSSASLLNITVNEGPINKYMVFPSLSCKRPSGAINL